MKIGIHLSFSTRMYIQDKPMALCLLERENRAPACLSVQTLSYSMFSHVVAHNRRYALFRRGASKDKINRGAHQSGKRKR